MPVMTHTPQFFSEPSALIAGVHPAFLMAITEEATPPTWEMFKKSPRMYRWHWAVAHSVQTLDSFVPELVTAVSSKIFSGGRQPSKNYTWHCTLLGRVIAVEESVDLDPLMPLPCQLAISRTKGGAPVEWAIVDTLYGWPEGQALLTEPFRQKLALWWSMKQQATPSEDTAVPPPQAPALPPMAAPAPAPAAGTAPAQRQAW